ncbi:MAG: Hpt domain-containing protein [Candidatus Muirbacterium halophilum]|nr:Hpt domain-containing protein [Candidatus Muirbacterium halophilum]
MIEILVDIDLEEFIPKYLQNKYDDIKKINEFIKEKNFDELRKIGHNFQGTGTSYGFEFVSKCGKNLRQSAILKDINTIKKIASELDYYFKNINVKYIKID